MDKATKEKAIQRLLMAVNNPVEACQIFDRNMNVNEMSETLELLNENQSPQ